MLTDIILELDPSEKLWWESEIKKYRDNIIQSPKHYIAEIIKKHNLVNALKNHEIETTIRDLRESAWQMYMEDEVSFHNSVLTHLIEVRDLPKDILKVIIEKRIFNQDIYKLSKEELVLKFASVVGDFAGRIMPYIYILSLSTTQSRRSRAGKTFEKIIETLLEFYQFPFDNQSSIGNAFYKTQNLGKMVDAIIPSKEKYITNRSKCAVITMKTTLRERWQEVVEELNRTNIPHIFLLTIDEKLTSNVINTLQQYNITIVTYDTFKESKFKEYENVIGYKKLFTGEIPHYVNYWK